MFIMIPLVIQIQGNQIQIGIAMPNPPGAAVAPQPTAQVAVPQLASGPGRLRQLLMNPSLN